MFLLVSSIMSILSFVYCLDYANIFWALSNTHFEFEVTDKLVEVLLTRSYVRLQ